MVARAEAKQQKWTEFDRSVNAIRDSAFTPEQQESRIRRLVSAHFGIEIALLESQIVTDVEREIINPLRATEIPRKPRKTLRERAKTIFHHH